MSEFTIPASGLTEAAATYGDALALGIRARLIGGWYADAAAAEQDAPKREALAAALAAERARLRAPKASQTEREDIAKALTVSPASITQARNAFDAVVASGARNARSDADAMQTAAEALGAGAVAKTLTATLASIAKMPESARSQALTETLAKARSQATEAKSAKAAAAKAAREAEAAKPESVKTREGIASNLTVSLAALTAAAKALADVSVGIRDVNAANAALADIAKALDLAKRNAALTATQRKAGALAAKAKAAPKVTAKPKAAPKPKAAAPKPQAPKPEAPKAAAAA